MTKRRKFSDKFKATVALEALRGDRTVQEIAAKNRVHPTQVTPWKRQAIEGLTGVFSDKIKRAENNEAKLKNCTPGSGGLQLKMIFCHKGSKDEPDKTQGNDQQGSHRS